MECQFPRKDAFDNGLSTACRFGELTCTYENDLITLWSQADPFLNLPDQVPFTSMDNGEGVVFVIKPDNVFFSAICRRHRSIISVSGVSYFEKTVHHHRLKHPYRLNCTDGKQGLFLSGSYSLENCKESCLWKAVISKCEYGSLDSSFKYYASNKDKNISTRASVNLSCHSLGSTGEGQLQISRLSCTM